ncbi:MAG: GNAT family N-acetyltransferase [Nitrococcus sp.]|nr:GNAT family N-acetyltransferase [Nitrococcus sp.]
MAELNPPRSLRDDDPVEEFDCGRDSMNAWFRRHARRNHDAGISRVTVLTEAGTGTIVGYVSLSAGHIEREYLAKSARRNRPENIPAIFLGQLAVDRRFQGRGFARQLLLYALKTCLALSREIGCFAVLMHPLDDDVRAFYCRFGFEALPGDPRRSMAVRITDLVHNGLQ